MHTQGHPLSRNSHSLTSLSMSSSLLPTRKAYSPVMRMLSSWSWHRCRRLESLSPCEQAHVKISCHPGLATIRQARNGGDPLNCMLPTHCKLPTHPCPGALAAIRDHCVGSPPGLASRCGSARRSLPLALLAYRPGLQAAGCHGNTAAGVTAE